MTSRGAMPVNWDALSVAESDAHPELVGMPLAEIAENRGDTMLDVMLDTALDDALTTRFNSVLANNDPDAIAWLLPRDGVLIGLADSGAHVSQLCDACFATDLLGHWVREQEVMTLERAVHKLTGEPAEVFGLTGRGRLEVGKAADVAVFDPDTVAPGPLRRITDFPAAGERLTADGPVGMEHVFVNGIAVRARGKDLTEHLESLPGVVLAE
jgi:N-acyl-D-aspartate/D-glutamate deacylase